MSRAGVRRVSRIKAAGLFCVVVTTVFAPGMLITNIDGMALPGAA